MMDKKVESAPAANEGAAESPVKAAEATGALPTFRWPVRGKVITSYGSKTNGKSDKTASAPVENPVHPRELLATIYHSVGIDPATMVLNHLNQPRELVQGEPVTGILS